MINVPNKTDFIPAIGKFARAISELAGFSLEEQRKIELALEEACLHVINHSFFPDEEAEYSIRFAKLASGLAIHVHDMGLPYDPSVLPDFNPSGDLLNQDLAGLGSFLIKSTMDEYQFKNLGIKGKEIVLTKYLPGHLVASENPEIPEPEIAEPPVPSNVEQINFEIRRMQANEALEICRCIYDCYGYSYANENVYFPERVAAMNQNGKLTSAVAMTPDGEMGGHFALIHYEKLPSEAGIAVTKKKFRGQGFARQLGEYLEFEARQAHLRGIQVKEVTAHPYTQKFCLKLGYKDCGLLLAHSPKSLSFKGIADTLAQRNSDVLGFKYLESPQQRTIYPPKQHQEMIEFLFSNLGDRVISEITESSAYDREKSSSEITVNHLRSLAEIFILETGTDLIPILKNEMKKIFRDEIQVIELYLSLNDPMAPQVVEQLESLGFIFTGILPETGIGDAMILQYFNGVHIDFDRIVLVTDTARQLMEYVKTQME